MLLVVVTVNTSIILSAFGTIVPNLGYHLDGAHLNVPVTIDHRKKHEQHAFLLPMAVVRSQECTTSAVGGSRELN